MALETIDEIVKAYTGTTSATEAELIPEVLSNEIELALRENVSFQPSVLENTELEGTAGASVFIPRLDDTGTVAALTEGTDISIISLDAADSVEYTPSEVGLAFGITRKALDRIKYDGIAIIVSQLGYAMTTYLESGIAKLYLGAVPGHAGETVDQVYPNGHSSADVVADDAFSDALLLEGVTQLRENKVPPFPDGYYRVNITPRQYASFISDTNVRDTLHFASPQVILQGEVGIYHNTRIVVSNWVDTVANEGAGANVKVHKAMLMSPRWAVIVWKRRPELTVDPTVYDFGRRRQFGITADLTMGLLHADRARVLASAEGN